MRSVILGLAFAFAASRPGAAGEIVVTFVPKGGDYRYTGKSTPLLLSMNADGQLFGRSVTMPLSDADVHKLAATLLKDEGAHALLVIDVQVPAKVTLESVDAMIRRIEKGVPEKSTLKVALRMNGAK